MKVRSVGGFRLRRRWSGFEPAVGLAVTLLIQGVSAASTSDPPAPIGVPAALQRENVSIEPSGVVWAAPLNRYLVVSDDTGTNDQKHIPRLLAMSREGAFDEAPVSILGIESLNDPEAICVGPEGTFFLTTSHSPNKKGHTSAARSMLLHLRLEGRALRVLGRVDLTTAADGKGGGLLQIAGLDPAGRLDIEAITYQQGALLVGLKSPLTSRGTAVILRLKEPAKALAAGRIEPGAVTRFREVALGTSHSQGAIDRGISDLYGLSDGSIVVLANSPKGMPSDGGGAIFWLKPGVSQPIHLNDFRGFKPEGVTLADDGKGLVLVFDNDLRPPLWARCPLPR